MSDFNIDMTNWIFNLNSGPQMQEFLYEFLGLIPIKPANEKTGNISVDENTIEHYAKNENIRFCTLLLALRKLLKAKNTYLQGIFRNISYDDFCVHPEYWLHTAITYRSSSTDPNFQNIPKHGEIMFSMPWEVIRKIITSLNAHINNDWFIAEFDYEGAETKVAAMLGGDPQMITDLNEDMDMHSHWAIQLFGLKGMSYEEVKKKYDNTYRFLAKNNFTFANFFGAQSQSIAKEMRQHKVYEEYVNSKWKQNASHKGSWEVYFIDFSEKQIEECQNMFYSRYHIYKAWQDSLVKAYYKNGYVDNPFGFRRYYPMTRNEIINFPIQSTSFLLLLDSIIKIEEETEKNIQWQSHLIGQVHDSGLANIYKYEAPDYIDFVDEIMCHKPYLPWTQSVKMGTDWSFGRNWYDMFKVSTYKQYMN